VFLGYFGHFGVFKDILIFSRGVLVILVFRGYFGGFMGILVIFELIVYSIFSRN
jgi:hypothetical protein